MLTLDRGAAGVARASSAKVRLLLRQLGMAMRLGVGNAPVGEPGVHLAVPFEPQPRREEALADKADLVLDLTLLPTRGRRAGHGIDDLVAAHQQEAAIVETVLAG